LQGLVRACIRAGADIVKIVTTARSSADNLSVLSLIPYGRSKGKEMIAFCMGEAGIVSRIAAPALGAYLTFASLRRGAESAPGQIAAAPMRRILRLLAGK
jgi:3-dehydroquinate dehydratase type I